ncbi:transporter substrate-binding domain-containing protein [Pseudomonas sp. Fl5BN2]|nr:transporter substrate-binding domain-containing protein [Pseudomonas sp. Fl5BN2]
MLRHAWGLCLILLAGSLSAQPLLRYCDYPVYPPISWSDGLQVRGLAPSLVRQVLEDLGYQVQVVVLGNWKRCLLDAAEGRVDVVLAYSTGQRQQDLLFSRVPVLREEVALFVNRRNPPHFRQLQDLRAYRGGLLFGESYGQDFDRQVVQHGNIEWVSSSQQNFGKLIRQRIDFIPYERRTGQLFIEQLPGAEDIVALPQAISVDYLRLAVSRQSPLAARMAEIDVQLQRQVDSGAIQRWLEESQAGYRAMLKAQQADRP